MKIVGINNDMHISSAALVDNGCIAAAAAEERFTRQKRTRVFPANAISYCLKEADCAVKDIDFLASAWNPGAYFRTFNPLVSSQRRWKSEYLYSVADNFISLMDPDEHPADHMRQVIPFGGREHTIYHITHHRAHAANAFLPSPFDEAAILTADSQGEFESTTFGHGTGNRINVFKTIEYPQSLGAFYSAITDYLGFRPNSDEWKVMALAAMCEDSDEIYKTMTDNVLRVLPDGGYSLDLSYFQGYLHEQPGLYSPNLVNLLGPARQPEDELQGSHFAVAAAAQRVIEDVIFHLLHWLHGETGATDLCLSGGLFMNASLNGKIIENTPFERLFISSCPDDSGNAIGAALYLNNHILGHKNRPTMTDNFLGPAFDDEVIGAELDRFGLAAESINAIEDHCAKLLAEGRVVGWFQGRMELGQRALGNRSILADPRRAEMKDTVNAAIKYRESFRPFAPALPIERVNEYFDLGDNGPVRFMERIHQVRAEKRAEIPAVVHDDGTARLQTVERESNPRFHSLLEAFGNLTGVPVLLNTSFNLNGEPIVCTPSDAIRTFYSCGLDALIMGNHVLTK